MPQKKLMLLGGIRYLLPVIKAAHEQGYYVITADYLPDNIAHKYSDEYVNVSIVDKEAVLKVAQEKQIDGIMSFAVDPGVISAAYVAEKMGLPFQCSYESACILQDKAKFRNFLSENGFNVPTAKGYSKFEDAIEDVDMFHWPVIVKPVDSAGSKGVSKADSPTGLKKAISFALSKSTKGSFIIEDFLEKEGLSSGSESFFVDGKLKYNAFYDQYFDNEAINPFTPSSECWPSDKDSKYTNEVRKELQRLGTLLQFRTGLFNIEWRVCTDGKIYLMEVSPRAGGNRLAEILNYATDIDIIDAEIKKSIGLRIDNIHEPNYKGFFSIFVLHSDTGGIFKGIEISKDIEKYIIEKEIRINIGDRIEAFTGANNAIGTLFLRFNNKEMCNSFSQDSHKYIKVNTSY